MFSFIEHHDDTAIQAQNQWKMKSIKKKKEEKNNQAFSWIFHSVWFSSQNVKAITKQKQLLRSTKSNEKIVQKSEWKRIY